jgi:hypothetical protein
MTYAVIVGFLISILPFIAPAAVRGDIRPELVSRTKHRPRPQPADPPPRPTLAGDELPRPLNVIVSGAALAAAVASAGVLLFRAGGKLRGVFGWGAILAAGLVLAGASALAYWSYSTDKQYEALKAKQQEDYKARFRNSPGAGVVRRPQPVDPPASKTISAPIQ